MNDAKICNYANDTTIYRVSQKNRGAFVELWRRIEPLDHRELNFSMQPTI